MIASEYGIYNVDINIMQTETLESIAKDVINTYETKQELIDQGISIESVSTHRFVKEANSTDFFNGVEYGNSLIKKFCRLCQCGIQR